VAGAVVVLALSACGDDRPGPVLPPVPSSGSASASASPAPSLSVRPTGTAEEQILGQYRRFWTEAYPAMIVAPATERSGILQPYVTEPLLGALLETARQFDRRNEESVGAPELSQLVVSRRAGEGVVVGCVDFTHVPLVNRSTGEVIDDKPLHVGSEMHLRRGRDGLWRGYRLFQPEGSRC
jgi:hypothetical protein